MPKYIYKAQGGDGKRLRGQLYADSEGELHMKLKEAGLFLVSFKVEDRHSSILAFKQAFKAAVLSDFNRQLGQLIGSGISLVRALNIMIQEESIKPRRRAVYEDILVLIRQGLPISDALELCTPSPPLMVSMYRAAEASGSLRKPLNDLQLIRKEHRVSMKIKNATAITKVLCFLTRLVLAAMFVFT
jgi:type IV pilus assembly protein PilC